MARSTFRKQITTYRFRALDPSSAALLGDVGFSVDEGPFTLSEYFTLDEAEKLRDDLTAAIEEVGQHRAAAKAKEEVEQGRSIAENDAIQAEAQS